MLEFDADRCRANVRTSSTEDLLDRATAFRGGLEAEAIPIIEAELKERGIDRLGIAAYAESRPTITGEDGMALKCTECQRPAVAVRRGWHRFWGIVPLFPRQMRWCERHLPKKLAGRASDEPAEA